MSPPQRRDRVYRLLRRKGILKPETPTYVRPRLGQLLWRTLLILTIAAIFGALAIHQFVSHTNFWKTPVYSFAAVLASIIAGGFLLAGVYEWIAFWTHRPR